MLRLIDTQIGDTSGPDIAPGDAEHQALCDRMLLGLCGAIHQRLLGHAGQRPYLSIARLPQIANTVITKLIFRALYPRLLLTALSQRVHPSPSMSEKPYTSTEVLISLPGRCTAL